MEHKQFISDDLDHSPYSNQGFQTDRFTKTTNNLNIPDTIPENCSAELSGESLKTEAPKIKIGTCSCDDDKENICCDQQFINNEPSNSSANLTIDNSYIKRCEKNLLESSYSDEEKNFELDNKGLVNRQLLEVQSKSTHYNDTISTPPSLLRKEISMLRNEMAEAHEFHDFEMKLLQEERSLDVVDSSKYIELFEKYSALVDLYSNLKTELDDYRKNQESMRNEFQSKTADYLESLCSQIETSDSSFNFSSSFVSFSGGVKSSTMMEEASEIEVTVVRDGTVLARDPLSITIDNHNGTLKTPTQSLVRSAKKLFPQKVSASVGKPTGEAKDSTAKRDVTSDSEYNIQLLNLETALYDKVKEVEDLEQRLFKVEDMSLVLHSEFERISSTYVKDNNALKEDLCAKTEQLNELIQKLFTETISLNPSLRDSLTDIPGSKLLGVFIETIMENCKKIKDDDQLTTIENLRKQLSSQDTKLMELEELRKTCEDWRAKFLDARNTISTREEEIKMLQSHSSTVRQTREDLESAKELVAELESKLNTVETEKTAIESRCRDLEKVEESLMRKVNESQTELEVVQERKFQIENENTHLKEAFDALKVQVTEKEVIIKSNESEIMAVKENLMSAEATIEHLKVQMKSLTEEKAELQKHYEQLQNTRNLQDETIAGIDETVLKLKSRLTALENEKSEMEEQCRKLKGAMESELEDLRRESEVAAREWDAKLKAVEAKKIDAENRYGDLEAVIQNLKREIDASQNLQKDLQTRLSIALEMKSDAENENSRLKELYETVKTKTENLASAHAEEIQSLNSAHAEEIKSLNSAHAEEIQSLNSAHAEEILTLNSAYAEEIQSLNSAHAGEIQTLNSAHAEEIQSLNSAHAEEIQSLNSAHAEEIQSLNSAHAEEIQSLKSAHDTELQAWTMTCEDLKMKIVEAENTISAQEKQIKLLQSDIERSQEETSSARAALLELETEKRSRDLQEADQLSRANTEKEEVEQRCRELEEGLSRLQADSSEKVLIIKDLEETKGKLESEREALRRESEESLGKLVNKLEAIEAEKTLAENRCGDLEAVVENLKREIDAGQNLEKEFQTRLSIVLETKSRAESENSRLKELYETVKTKTENLASAHAEEIQSLNSAHAEEIQSLKSAYDTELQALRMTCEDHKTKIIEAENTISAQEKQIKLLQSDIERCQEETSSARAALLELETEKRTRELEEADQLSRANSEKEEVEQRCRELEEGLWRLQADSNGKMMIIKDLEETKGKLESERDVLVLQNLSADETNLKLKSQMTALNNEKLEMEIQFKELQEINQNLQAEIISAKKLENNPAYQGVQIENDGLKQRVFEYEKMVTDLKAELEIAKDNQRKNVFKIEELIREVEDLKIENTGFSYAFVALEETQRNLADVLSNVGKDSDLPGDWVTKVIAKTSKAGDTRETKIVADFVETVSKTCKGVQNELIKKFDSEKQEWEIRRDVDLRNLREQIELLVEKSEMQEAALKRVTDDLTTAHDVIQKLKSELSSTQKEKYEAEQRCQELERGALNLQAEIDTKETIIKGLDELKLVREKLESENGDLKKQVLESEEVVIRLKTCLKVAQEEQTDRELKLKDIQSEILVLKKEKETLIGASERLRDLERSHKNLVDLLSDLQSHLDLPEDTLPKFLSEETTSRKIFIERINGAIRTQMDVLKVENRNLKLGHDSLKERVKQLTRIIEETTESEPKDLSNVSTSYMNGMNVKNKSGKRMDGYARRLDKLEEINHNLTELLHRILTTTEFPDVEKLNLSSLRDFPKTMKKVLAHLDDFVSKMKELDEECETYSNIIKDLKKEAVAVWKSNMEKAEALEAEIGRLKGEKHSLENEKQDLLGKISRLDMECQKLQATPKTEGSQHGCACGKDSKRVNELKRIILMKEQKLLELQDLEGQTCSLKSQIEYLKTALEREKKKAAEEKERNKKLQNQINEANEKPDKKKSEENLMLEELRMRGSISGGIVQEFGDKEKMRKLAKDIAILKELCRARYAEIKRLEAVNAALRNATPKQATTPKNSNQMDSPIHSRGYNTRSKHRVRDVWKSEIVGKENGGV